MQEVEARRVAGDLANAQRQVQRQAAAAEKNQESRYCATLREVGATLKAWKATRDTRRSLAKAIAARFARLHQ